MLRIISVITAFISVFITGIGDIYGQHHNLPACNPNRYTLTRKDAVVAVKIPSRVSQGKNRCDYDAMMMQAEFDGPASVVLISCLFPQTKETVQSFWEGKKDSRWVMFFPPNADVVCTTSLLGGPGPVEMTVVGTRYRRTEARDEYDL